MSKDRMGPSHGNNTLDAIKSSFYLLLSLCLLKLKLFLAKCLQYILNDDLHYRPRLNLGVDWS
jgi:hypothetical protein